MYDYAKVYQSVCGYDFVLLDRPRCDAYVDGMRTFADHELSERLGGEGLRYLRIVTGASVGRPAVWLIDTVDIVNGWKSVCSARSELVLFPDTAARGTNEDDEVL